jgi:hypothetical protein
MVYAGSVKRTVAAERVVDDDWVMRRCVGIASRHGVTPRKSGIGVEMLLWLLLWLLLLLLLGYETLAVWVSPTLIRSTLNCLGLQ